MPAGGNFITRARPRTRESRLRCRKRVLVEDKELVAHEPSIN